jgi:hypothetical protein
MRYRPYHMETLGQKGELVKGITGAIVGIAHIHGKPNRR